MRRISVILGLFSLILLGLHQISGSAALSSQQVDRSPLLSLAAADTAANAALLLTNYNNYAPAGLTVGGNYVQVGTIQNMLSASSSLSQTISPTVTRACRNASCGQGAWRLYYCFSTDTTAVGTKVCSGAQQTEIQFSGTGPLTAQPPLYPAPLSVGPLTNIASGGSAYLMVRVEITGSGGASYWCGTSTFSTTSSGTTTGVSILHDALSARSHTYRFGSGCP